MTEESTNSNESGDPVPIISFVICRQGRLCNCPIITRMNLISSPAFAWGHVFKTASTIARDDPVEYK